MSFALNTVTQRVIYYKKLRNAFSVMLPGRGSIMAQKPLPVVSHNLLRLPDGGASKKALVSCWLGEMVQHG